MLLSYMSSAPPSIWKTLRKAEGIILITLITLHSITVEGSECPANLIQSNNGSCTRLSSKRYDLVFFRSLYQHDSHPLTAEIEEKEYVKLSCSDIKSPADLTLVSGLNVGPVTSFEMRFCPLPDTSFKELLLSMGIKQIKILEIQNVNDSRTLERKHLEGLNEINKLNFQAAGLKEIPEDLFMDMPNLTWLTLSNNDITHLPKGIFKHTPKLEVLELGNNLITHLEPGIFRNLSHLRLLNLWRNKLAHLSRAVFSDTPNLENLDLNSNSLVSLPADLFTDLVELKNINLLGNMITALPKGLFSSNPSLVKFALKNNRNSLNLIAPGLLSNLTNLKEVHLSNCNVSSIPEDLIWDSPNVSQVMLNGNFLSELPKDLFRDSSALHTIDISENRLTSLPDTIFVGTKNLIMLIAHHNQLTDISSELLIHMSALEKVDFSNNRLMHIHGEAFLGNQHLKDAIFFNNFLTMNNSAELNVPTDIFGPRSPFKTCLYMENLNLANNSITQIFFDWQQILSHLKVLDLSHNKISYLEAADLQFLSKEKLVVNLSFNNISVINLVAMETLALYQYGDEIKPHYQNPLNNHSVRISLAGNPFECNCKNYYLRKYFNYELTPEVYYMIDFDTFDVNCAEPNELKGYPLNKTPTKLFVCPIDLIITQSKKNYSICPERCGCFYRPVDKGLIIDCKKKNITGSLPDNFLLSTMEELEVNEILKRNINHTELDLSENNITSLPQELGNGFKNVTKLILSSNYISHIDAYKLSPNINVLELNNNNLSYLDSDSIRFLSHAEKVSISLHDNPWQCDCKSKDMLSFLQNYYDKIYMLPNVTCTGGRPMSELTVNDICPFSTTAVMLMSFIIAFIGLIIGILIALYYRYNQEIKVWLYANQLCLWFVTEEEVDRDKLYDAFISYSHQDEEFVINHIVKELEGGTPKFKLCLHYRDWVVGDYIPTQIARSVENSRRTIVILSHNFRDSVWGKMEFRTAHTKALTEGRARVIVILYGDIGPTEDLEPELKAYISMNTYIKWGDPWFWDRLRFALPHPSKPSKGIPLFQRNIARQQNRPVLNIDKDDLIKESDPNATPPAATTPPANSFIDQTPSLIPNGQTNGFPESMETSNHSAKIKY